VLVRAYLGSGGQISKFGGCCYISGWTIETTLSGGRWRTHSAAAAEGRAWCQWL